MAKTGEQHYQDYQNYIAEGRVQSAGLSLLTACLCGYCPAQAELGYKYLHGILFPKDYEQAMRMGLAAGSASAFSEELAAKPEVEALMREL